jgi:hypothetical protein
MSTKFDNIEFPFFGLKDRPYKISYLGTSVTISKFKYGKVSILDDISLEGNYSERLLQLDTLHPQTRIVFDFTFLSMQQLIKSSDKVKWGLDAQGRSFKLNKKQKFKAKIAQVKKKNDNLLWIDGISYPFEIPHMIDDFKSKDLYALLIKVNHTWYVKEFTHEHNYIKEIKI